MSELHQTALGFGDDPKIFAMYAPNYFAAGFSVIPIIPGTKRPAIQAWSGYCDNLPRAETQRDWLHQFGDHGIGICMGREMIPGYRFAGIDIDSDALRGPIRGLMGFPKVSKRGKKGETIFVMAEKSIRSTSLKDAAGKQVLDLLVGGKQSVLPPTIHPDTGTAYEWVGAESLPNLSVDKLPVLDARKLEVLKVLVASEHTAALIAGMNDDHA